MHSCKRISNWPFWFALYRGIGGTWCNATNKMQCKKQTNINWMSRLSSLKFVLGMFDLLTHIQLISMHGETLCCQTVKPCASLQAHTYSLCAAVAGRCYKMDGSIMSLKTTGRLHATQLGSRTNSNGSESVQSVL